MEKIVDKKTFDEYVSNFAPDLVNNEEKDEASDDDNKKHQHIIEQMFNPKMKEHAGKQAIKFSIFRNQRRIYRSTFYHMSDIL